MREGNVTKGLKETLVSGIESEIELMKKSLVNRVMKLPDGDMATLYEFVTSKRAAAIIGVSLPTLRKYRSEGILRRFRLGNKFYYRRSELQNAFKED